MSDYCLHCGLEKHRAGGCDECGAHAPGIDVPSEPNYLPPGTPLNHGRYLIGRILGIGGFGVTYLGVDTRLGMRLAVKELFPADSVVRGNDGRTVTPLGNAAEAFNRYLDRFLMEAQVLVPFGEHPNIVSIKGFFKENGTAYIAMPYLDGMSLDDYLAAKGRTLSEEEAVNIAVAVLDGLRATHAKNLLHRDIKPQNIFITNDGLPKLIDFGSAREVLDDTGKLTAFVTEGYTPFEQYQSELKQAPSADVYAVGATLYRMIVGDVPPPSVSRMVDDRIVPPNRTGARVSPGVSAAIMNALAPRPENRFQTAAEFADALIAATASGVSAAPVPPPRGTGRIEKIRRGGGATTMKVASKSARKRAAMRFLAVGIGLLVVVGMLAAVLSSRDSADGVAAAALPSLAVENAAVPLPVQPVQPVQTVQTVQTVQPAAPVSTPVLSAAEAVQPSPSTPASTSSSRKGNGPTGQGSAPSTASGGSSKSPASSPAPTPPQANAPPAATTAVPGAPPQANDGRADLGIVSRRQAQQFFEAKVLPCLYKHGAFFFSGEIGIRSKPGPTEVSAIVETWGSATDVDFQRQPDFRQTPLGRCVVESLDEYRLREIRGHSYQDHSSTRFSMRVSHPELIAKLGPDVVLSEEYAREKMGPGVRDCMKAHNVQDLRVLVGTPSQSQVSYRPIHVYPGAGNKVDGQVVNNLPDLPLGKCVDQVVSKYRAHLILSPSAATMVVTSLAFKAI